MLPSKGPLASEDVLLAPCSILCGPKPAKQLGSSCERSANPSLEQKKWIIGSSCVPFKHTQSHMAHVPHFFTFSVNLFCQSFRTSLPKRRSLRKEQTNMIKFTPLKYFPVKAAAAAQLIAFLLDRTVQ